MNVKRQSGTVRRLALSASVLVAGCSSKQSAATEEVAEVEARASLSSSDEMTTKAEYFSGELFVTSVEDLDAETGQISDDRETDSDGVTAKLAPVVGSLANDGETSTPSTPPSTTAQVLDIDLVACANVETGYLLLLNGHPAKAEPFLLLGSRQASTSSNPDYSTASKTLSAAAESEQAGAADSFLTLCEIDGFERLA